MVLYILYFTNLLLGDAEYEQIYVKIMTEICPRLAPYRVWGERRFILARASLEVKELLPNYYSF